jgi:hypothetical protein
MQNKAEVNTSHITTQEIEVHLENATLLLEDEDTEILTRLHGADGVAHEMEQKLDAVLSDLDKLLAQLDSGDMNEATLDSREKPTYQSGSGDK